MPIPVNERRLFNGPTDDLMQIRPLKHAWAAPLLQEMQDNNWSPREVPMGDDVICYRNHLTDGERRMYDKALAFLSNLDGIQLNNLVFNIGQHVTSPEVRMCITRQAWEEAVHVLSYATMIEEIGADPVEIYNMFETDELLAAKNQYIMRCSAVLKSEPTMRNKALAIVANVILEGIYFFSGFLAFYTLAKSGKMLMSANMIKYIQRDEEGTHLKLFVSMYRTMKEENPEIFDAQFAKDAVRLVEAAVDHEIAWGKHIISGGVLGLTDHIIEGFVRYLADLRLNDLGLPALYGVKNPVPWFWDFSKVEGSLENFFESRKTDYSVGGALSW